MSIKGEEFMAQAEKAKVFMTGRSQAVRPVGPGPNFSPGRKAWVRIGDTPSAVGAAHSQLTACFAASDTPSRIGCTASSKPAKTSNRAACWECAAPTALGVSPILTQAFRPGLKFGCGPTGLHKVERVAGHASGVDPLTTDEVYTRRDPQSGDLILSEAPGGQHRRLSAVTEAQTEKIAGNICGYLWLSQTG
jgi:hypothetical protein